MKLINHVIIFFVIFILLSMNVPAQVTNQTNVTTNVTVKNQCEDGIDNDGDKLIDFPADPGCAFPNDNDEYNPPPKPEKPVEEKPPEEPEVPPEAPPKEEEEFPWAILIAAAPVALFIFGGLTGKGPDDPITQQFQQKVAGEGRDIVMQTTGIPPEALTAYQIAAGEIKFIELTKSKVIELAKSEIAKKFPGLVKVIQIKDLIESKSIKTKDLTQDNKDCLIKNKDILKCSGVPHFKVNAKTGEILDPVDYTVDKKETDLSNLIYRADLKPEERKKLSNIKATSIQVHQTKDEVKFTPDKNSILKLDIKDDEGRVLETYKYENMGKGSEIVIDPKTGKIKSAKIIPSEDSQAYVLGNRQYSSVDKDVELIYKDGKVTITPPKDKEGSVTVTRPDKENKFSTSQDNFDVKIAKNKNIEVKENEITGESFTISKKDKFELNVGGFKKIIDGKPTKRTFPGKIKLSEGNYKDRGIHAVEGFFETKGLFFTISEKNQVFLTNEDLDGNTINNLIGKNEFNIIQKTDANLIIATKEGKINFGLGEGDKLFSYKKNQYLGFLVDGKSKIEFAKSKESQRLFTTENEGQFIIRTENKIKLVNSGTEHTFTKKNKGQTFIIAPMGELNQIHMKINTINPKGEIEYKQIEKNGQYKVMDRKAEQESRIERKLIAEEASSITVDIITGEKKLAKSIIGEIAVKNQERMKEALKQLKLTAQNKEDYLKQKLQASLKTAGLSEEKIPFTLKNPGTFRTEVTARLEEKERFEITETYEEHQQTQRIRRNIEPEQEVLERNLERIKNSVKVTGTTGSPEKRQEIGNRDLSDFLTNLKKEPGLDPTIQSLVVEASKEEPPEPLPKAALRPKKPVYVHPEQTPSTQQKEEKHKETKEEKQPKSQKTIRTKKPETTFTPQIEFQPVSVTTKKSLNTYINNNVIFSTFDSQTGKIIAKGIQDQLIEEKKLPRGQYALTYSIQEGTGKIINPRIQRLEKNKYQTIKGFKLDDYPALRMLKGTTANKKLRRNLIRLTDRRITFKVEESPLKQVK